MKYIKYFFEFLFSIFFFIFFKIIGPKQSSDVSGKIFEIIGPFFRSKKVIHNNLNRALPGIDENNMIPASKATTNLAPPAMVRSSTHHLKDQRSSAV